MKNIHILPTDKPSRLHSYKGVLNLAAGEFVAPTIVKNDLINQNIYITSDEDIEEGDYCISYLNIIDEGKIHNSQTIFNPKTKEHLILLQSCKKIILTTDTDLIKDGVQTIDDEFLEWFVKNPSCEKVEVKTRYVHYYKTGETFISLSKTPEFSSRNMQCIKIEPRYEIIIPIVEPKQEKHICKYCKAETSQSDDECYAKPKQETLEDAAEVYANKKGDIPTTKLEDAIFKQGFIDGAKSDAAKNYWFKIFKKEFIVSLNGK